MKKLLALLTVMVLVGSVDASDRRGRRGRGQTFQDNGYSSGSMPPITPYVGKDTSCSDALDEVNASRAKMGLPPFARDPLLTQGAYECAKRRASRNIAGHLPESDFSCLPPGANATAAGAGALEPSWGWQSCCYDSREYTVAGAAWVMSGGRRFMSIFVR